MVAGIGAYHIPSRVVRHLGFAAAGKNGYSRVRIEDASGFAILDKDRFLFSTELLAKKTTAKTETTVPPLRSDLGSDSHRDERLWDWDLRLNKARPWGPNEFVPIRLARAVRLTDCKLVWKSTNASPSIDGTATVVDSHSKKSAAVTLHLGCRASAMDSQTFAATENPSVFAVCDAWNVEVDGRLDVYCVDPNAAGGIRWRIDKNALALPLGLTITGAELLDNGADPTSGLFLLLKGVNKDRESCVFALRMNAITGRVDKSIRLPINDNFTEPNDVAISPNKRILVARAPSLDRSNAEDYVRFRVVDLESGKYRDTRRFSGELAECRLAGFINDRDVILSSDCAIYSIDITAGILTNPKLVFELNKFSDQWK